MAKTSKLVRNAQRKELVARFAEKRARLKAIIVSQTASEAEKEAAGKALRKLPRESSAVRVRNRCSMSGRPRAYLRQFGISRIALRDMALMGLIPGVRKASW
jgi:small subunit ribosomal protein S14